MIDGPSRDSEMPAASLSRQPIKTVHDRRTFLLGVSAISALATVVPFVQAASAFEQVPWQDAMKALVGDVTPAAARVRLDLPEAMNGGAMVPFTVAVDSPMIDDDHVLSVHVLATGNPRPDVASFFFTPQSGRAAASSRMRLWRSQEIVAIAEMNNGDAYMGRRFVQIAPTPQ